MVNEARRVVGFGVLVVLGLWGGAARAQEKATVATLGPDRLAALDRITADSLKGHLSFLSSDLLEGRDTPSKGLDLAAEYIAAQFRRAGLEPVGDDGYFQTANWEIAEPDPASYKFEVMSQGRTLSIPIENVISQRLATLDIPATPVYKLDLKTAADLDLSKLAGKVVMVEIPSGPPPAPEEQTKVRDGLAKIGQSPAKLVVSISKRPLAPNRPAGRPGSNVGQLIDPKNPEAGQRPGPPQVTVNDPELTRLFDAWPAGENATTVLIHGGSQRRPVKLRNVVGLLRGSDPALKESCVMVTAHYDHIGVRGAEGTDRIFNGANDDGSGTVSVVEIASALATLKDHPRRSILFVTFFGEEKGLLGSRYYGRNPIVPVEKTVADVNLEQVGRTDDLEGPQVNRASLTGFGYSGVSDAFVKAGEAEGIAVVKHPRNSDAFFGRSDNQALADLGVPAHTLCVAFQYPDYHGAADHWDKVDYANMARIDRMVARALLTLADDTDEPKWDSTNPRAARYLKAWKDRRAK